jgi:methyl-accepting chemotaxis protein
MRAARLSVAAVALASLAGGVVTSGCDVQRAVDCARLALAVANSGDTLENAVLTSLVEDDAGALEELHRDVEELKDRVRDTDVREAADSVAEAADNVQRAAEEGGEPDLTPLADATDELTEVCTPSGE